MERFLENGVSWQEELENLNSYMVEELVINCSNTHTDHDCMQ